MTTTQFILSEIQSQILKETGVKTSVRKYSGSMKNHIGIRPMYQNGEYPKFPFEWANDFKKKFSTIPGHENYSSSDYIDILKINFSDLTPVKYSKERKPKQNTEKTTKGWGSKNSQLRLDKASARYSKALRRGEDRARYY